MASQQEQDALRQMILAFRVPDLQLLLGKQIVHFHYCRHFESFLKILFHGERPKPELS